jgi:hypothetical protein
LEGYKHRAPLEHFAVRVHAKLLFGQSERMRKKFCVCCYFFVDL